MTALLVSAALNAILCALSMAAILHSYPFVLNELGFPPLTAEDAAFLFEIINRGNQMRKSTLLTSNKSFGQWGETLSTASSTPAREPRSDSLCMSCC
jgi:hypothetical protein